MDATAFLLFAWFIGPVAAQGMDACMQAYNGEVVAIEREAKARQKAGSDAAKQRAAYGAEARIDAASRRAKKCQDDARAQAALAPQKPAADGECKARVNARMVELQRRFDGGALDPAQQSLRREEEVKLQAELNACNRRAP